MTAHDASGTLDEAFERLHSTGPERADGWLSNHAPMVVEALTARGHAAAVHRWLDLYRDRLDDFPSPFEPITDANRREALGDPRRAADWIAYFEHAVGERPWRDVLAEWWPRLLPGIAAGATHPAIRVGHAVRALLDGGPEAPRTAELAHGLGYWAARHLPLDGVAAEPAPPGAETADAALDAVVPIDGEGGGYLERIARLRRLPDWTAGVSDPVEAHRLLAETVRAAVHRYAVHAEDNPIMVVHAATAPNAVLRVLPALPRRLWVPSLQAAWTASAAVTALYGRTAEAPYLPPPAGTTPEEVMERALANGNDHVIKLTDTALDVGGERALAAAGRAVALIDPLA